jgi:hypothetical protein
MQAIKPFNLLIIALVVCCNLFSQSNVYKPFPQVYGSWVVYKQGPLGPGLTSFSSWQKYEALGDTTIGSYTYKKVTVANNTGYPTWNGTTTVIPFGPSVFSFGYRNDVAAKKAYYLDVTGGVNKDTLWYDFNLNVGDTLKETYAYYSYGINSNNQRRIVSSIDSVLICGAYYKRFNFGCSISGGFETELIEGVGFKDKFDATNFGGGCPFEPYYIYSTTFSICDITSIETYLKDNQLTLYPNPTNSELKISNSLNISNYCITNNMGEVILKGTDSSTINVAELANGIYIIKIQDKSGKSYQSKFIKQ